MNDNENQSSITNKPDTQQSDFSVTKAPSHTDGKDSNDNPLKEFPFTHGILNFFARYGAAAIVALLTLYVLYRMKSPTWVIFIGAFGIFFVLVNYLTQYIYWPYPKEVLPHLIQKHTPERPQESSFREIVETIVFVVVLVLMLKSFAAEAFVIPTGSMAETLFGYQKEITCVECGYTFPVNASDEAEGKDGIKMHVGKCTCPNCRQRYHLVLDQVENADPTPGGDIAQDLSDPGWKSGDRVLVVKYIYDLFEPERLDVVVFKFPEKPQENYTQMNYIKRLIGLPGETIVIRGGDVFALPASKSPNIDLGAVNPKDLWKRDYLNELTGRKAQAFVEKHPFEMIRKSPEILLDMRRIVYDNNHQPKDLKAAKWQRWRFDSNSGWQKAEEQNFRCSAGDSTTWLKYNHIIRSNDGARSLITDFMGYNWEHNIRQGANWVGDLIVECDVDVQKQAGEFVLSLNKGVDAFEARWNLSTGECTLFRNDIKIASKPTELTSGKHSVRFANVDQRLTVWVDGELPFGDGVNYDAPENKGPTEQDLQPAKIGIKGTTAEVSNLSLWRDTYYTVGESVHFQAAHAPNTRQDVSITDWTDPQSWSDLRTPPAKVITVQPGHYFCMGDNSTASSDGRTWGLVPKRLLLGRALMVYWPFDRAGPIR